jgi:hypothetical protein
VDRAFVYEFEQIKAIDIARTNVFAMIGLGNLAKAILGAGPLLNDLTCVPTGPASLSVLLNPGEIYQIENVDNTAFGPLPVNTSQQIIKCGQLLTQQTFTFTAPVTPGQSIDYLIQVQYQYIDTDPESRPFYLMAPATVDTVRRGILSATVKPGIPATTGTQVPPSPDAGYAGAWVITVANGQTQIIAGDISYATPSIFIIDKLQDKITEAQGDVRYPLSASFLNSVSANGYQKFPGGLIMQWGTTGVFPNTGTALSSISQSYPIPFLNNVFSITNTGQGSTDGLGTAFIVRGASASLTTIDHDAVAISGGIFSASTAKVSWMAIGN